jgi:hypothetical protein
VSASASGADIAGVIARMEAIDASLPRADGVAYFNRLYLQVTKSVQTAAQGVAFEAPAFLSRLDVVFADLYFAAEATIATGAKPPAAWRPLIEARAESREPIQFALAGMNAHINHDLPLAVVQTCTEMSLSPDDGSPQHHDYETVNAILAGVEKQVAGWFETGLIADLTAVTPKAVDDAIAMWSIVEAREIAWHNAQILWGLRGEPFLASAFADTLASLVGLGGSGLLI